MIDKQAKYHESEAKLKRPQMDISTNVDVKIANICAVLDSSIDVENNEEVSVQKVSLMLFTIRSGNYYDYLMRLPSIRRESKLLYSINFVKANVANSTISDNRITGIKV